MTSSLASGNFRNRLVVFAFFVGCIGAPCIAQETQSSTSQGKKSQVAKAKNDKADEKMEDVQVPLAAEVRLDVPLVKQKRMLCGPATIEMLFKYWGVTEYDQFDIARSILLQNPTLDRVVKSGILKDEEINWKKYPGTGTSTMRNFLRAHARTLNHYVKDAPSDKAVRLSKEKRQFEHLKRNLMNGIPVIVLQKNHKSKKGTHYRLAVGYDEKKEIVYLNDAAKGATITQSYGKFLKDWNVDQKYLHYNQIEFNIDKEKLDVELEHVKKKR